MSGPAPFWDWSGALWQHPEVERICLRLQDAHGMPVAGILYALWCAERDSGVTERTFLQVRLREWERDTLAPVRAARRACCGDGESRQLAHRLLRKLELQLESQCFQRLEAQPMSACANPPAREVLRLGNLKTLARYCGSAPQDQLNALVRIVNAVVAGESTAN